jgi:ATP-binding cassette subfamily F protein 3
MGFSGAPANTRIASLSGGEKARLLLGLAAFNGPHLLILDEPTNHLDIASRQALVEALNDFPGAVILISHDRSLLDAAAERLWLVADGTVRPYEGDLDEYQQFVLRKSSPKERSPSASDAPARRDAAPKRPALGPLRKQIKEAETAMARMESEIARLDARLAAPGFYEKDPREAAQVSATRAQISEKLATEEERWITLSAELERIETGTM